jgi:proteasome lid subunit RPN8/RPN11
VIVVCDFNAVNETLIHLRAAGEKHCECVVLWLGHREDKVIRVVRAYRPEQTAREDIFRIPPRGMDALRSELRQQRLMVAAQVHSHPGEAFHSAADDYWAIVRHEGALSLVVPRFAATTMPENFLSTTKVFRFSAGGKWLEVVGAHEVEECLQLT